MRRRIRGDYANGVASVGEEIGVEVDEPLLNPVAQQLPAALAVAAIVDAIDERVIVFIQRVPRSLRWNVCREPFATKIDDPHCARERRSWTPRDRKGVV